MAKRVPISAPDVVVHRVLPIGQHRSLDDYVAAGGGAGRSVALDSDAAALIDIVTQSGLRGRGGAGFPTGTKWSTVAGLASDVLPTTVVINGAEGEPGTFKDRAILRANPYAVLEGALIAARAVGAPTAIVALKATFTQEIRRVEDAIAEIEAAGWVDRGVLSVFQGPREYLYGEETALLESLRAGAEAYASEPDVARSILTLAATDPDAAVALQRFERGRWPGMRNLARRLESQGSLRHDLSRDEAAQILWVLTSFPTFDQLVRERGLSAGGVADRLRAMAEHTLLRAPAPDAP